MVSINLFYNLWYVVCLLRYYNSGDKYEIMNSYGSKCILKSQAQTHKENELWRFKTKTKKEIVLLVLSGFFVLFSCGCYSICLKLFSSLN